MFASRCPGRLRRAVGGFLGFGPFQGLSILGVVVVVPPTPGGFGVVRANFYMFDRYAPGFLGGQVFQPPAGLLMALFTPPPTWGQRYFGSMEPHPPPAFALPPFLGKLLKMASTRTS